MASQATLTRYNVNSPNVGIWQHTASLKLGLLVQFDALFVAIQLVAQVLRELQKLEEALVCWKCRGADMFIV